MKGFALILISALLTSASDAQSWPDRWTILPDQQRLISGLPDTNDLYNPFEIVEFRLRFPDPEYWKKLERNYVSGEPVIAQLTVNGMTYDSVGVSIKGVSSYLMLDRQHPKKSFSIKTNVFVPGQDVEGYTSFNLNNGFQDPSFLREYLYYRHIGKYIPAPRCSFVLLYINDEPWGLYTSVQQINKDFLRDWFRPKGGSLWRANIPRSAASPLPPPIPPAPGNRRLPPPNPWGRGRAGLNDLGPDTTTYQQHYTLKSSSETEPWQYLSVLCQALSQPADSIFERQLPTLLDVDRTLWLLAIENVFGDEDSYTYKGEMDYFVYHDTHTGRIIPLEYDGNSVLTPLSVRWSPFEHADSTAYPLLNKLLSVPLWKQRYIAHLRAVLDDSLNDQWLSEIDSLGIWLDSLVLHDEKKIYGYERFLGELETLKELSRKRRATILAYPGLSNSGPEIQSVELSQERNQSNLDSSTTITIEVRMAEEADVFLYLSNGPTSIYTPLQMLDDGRYPDKIAGDLIYTFSRSREDAEMITCYVEAISMESPHPVSIHPAAAPHDVFFIGPLPAR